MELRGKTPVKYVPEPKKKKSPGSDSSSGGQKKARKSEEESVVVEANRKIADILKAFAEVYQNRDDKDKAGNFTLA